MYNNSENTPNIGVFYEILNDYTDELFNIELEMGDDANKINRLQQDIKELKGKEIAFHYGMDIEDFKRQVDALNDRIKSAEEELSQVSESNREFVERMNKLKRFIDTLRSFLGVGQAEPQKRKITIIKAAQTTAAVEERSVVPPAPVVPPVPVAPVERVEHRPVTVSERFTNNEVSNRKIMTTISKVMGHIGNEFITVRDFLDIAALPLTQQAAVDKCIRQSPDKFETRGSSPRQFRISLSYISNSPVELPTEPAESDVVESTLAGATRPVEDHDNETPGMYAKLVGEVFEKGGNAWMNEDAVAARIMKTCPGLKHKAVLRGVHRNLHRHPEMYETRKTQKGVEFRSLAIAERIENASKIARDKDEEKFLEGVRIEDQGLMRNVYELLKDEKLLVPISTLRSVLVDYEGFHDNMTTQEKVNIIDTTIARYINKFDKSSNDVTRKMEIKLRGAGEDTMVLAPIIKKAQDQVTSGVRNTSTQAILDTLKTLGEAEAMRITKYLHQWADADELKRLNSSISSTLSKLAVQGVVAANKREYSRAMIYIHKEQN